MGKQYWSCVLAWALVWVASQLWGEQRDSRFDPATVRTTVAAAAAGAVDSPRIGASGMTTKD